jgi:hypothetical protein
MAQAGEDLLYKCKALSSNPSPIKTKQNKTKLPCRRSGSRGKAPALQVQSPELKPERKHTKKSTELINFSLTEQENNEDSSY